MYDQLLTDVFSNINVDNLSVINTSFNIIFTCGGLVDVTNPKPVSMRGKLYEFSSTEFEDIHDSLRMAESFKDYIDSGEYSDLLTFEYDLASLSSLILIFLESPGSLVELGIFSMQPEFFNKLCIIVPEEEVSKEDSFIYLGPLKKLKISNNSSVMVYPFNEGGGAYNSDNWNDICCDISNKLGGVNKQERFKVESSGHASMLILEIINIAFPIQITEIELSLKAIGISIQRKKIQQLIYVLTMLGFVEKKSRSTNIFYFPKYSFMSETYVKIGKYRDGTSFDKNKNKIRLKTELYGDLKDKESRRISLLKRYSDENS